MAAELQLLELLLAYPSFVRKVIAVVKPEDIIHADARRVLVELYGAYAAGLVPDFDALRERLTDRPDLIEAAARRQFTGLQMQEPDQWLGRILKRFEDMKVEAVQKQLKEQLASASGDEAIELLRRLQQTQEKKNRG
jgi:DNA primase